MYSKEDVCPTVTNSWWGVADVLGHFQEFRAWLIEERMLNRETMNKEQEKKQFAIFVEDYNTATLPHEKFYVSHCHLSPPSILTDIATQNMAKYEKRMNQIRNGELLPQSTEYDPGVDLAAHSASHKRTTVEHDSFLSKEQLAALRKVQMERIEVSSYLAKGC